MLDMERKRAPLFSCTVTKHPVTVCCSGERKCKAQAQTPSHFSYMGPAFTDRCVIVLLWCAIKMQYLAADSICCNCYSNVGNRFRG